MFCTSILSFLISYTELTIDSTVTFSRFRINSIILLMMDSIESINCWILTLDSTFWFFLLVCKNSFQLIDIVLNLFGSIKSLVTNWTYYFQYQCQYHQLTFFFEWYCMVLLDWLAQKRHIYHSPHNTSPNFYHKSIYNVTFITANKWTKAGPTFSFCSTKKNGSTFHFI